MLLGKYLTDNLQGFPTRSYERAFLFGCVEPDYNVFTFLKGSLRESMFCGHNFKNAERLILRTAERLQQRKHWWILEYYRLGKLIHYLSDAFTSPHNDSYSIADHALYEIRLHSYLAKCIAGSSGMPQKCIGESVVEYILTTHQQYINALKSPNTDVQYILDTTGMVFSLLLPEEEILVGSQVAL